MLYGVSYYPEQKTKEELEQDLVLIKESGINTVRMGEFAWSRMEPEEGHFALKNGDAVVPHFGGGHATVSLPHSLPAGLAGDRTPGNPLSG